MMRIGIKYKLFLAMMGLVCALVAAMFFSVRWSVQRGFLEYVSATEEKRLDAVAANLKTAYEQTGNWSFLKDDDRRWHDFVLSAQSGLGFDEPRREPRRSGPLEASARRSPPGPPGKEPRRQPSLDKGEPPPQWEPPPRRGALPPEMAERFEMRVSLFDAQKKRMFGPPEPIPDAALQAVEVDGSPVGYLGFVPPRILSDVQLRFLQDQKRAFALIALFTLVIAATFSIPLAHGLVRRLKLLTGATHDLSSGRYDIRVPAGSADELGQLSRDFNNLATTLQKNEQVRRQWVADISHELRTPVALLKGELEALQDGIRTFTPNTLAALKGDVSRLERLINDLYQLALSDMGALSYRKANVDLRSILEAAFEQFRDRFEEKDIAVELDLGDGVDATLFADSERLHQLFANLLENSLRYTDGGGRVELRLQRTGPNAVVHIEDSAPGVPEVSLRHLFDRFYRQEASRNRASGGAGLGLAICRNVVDAHGGSIGVEASRLGGLRFRITLPLAV